MRTSQGRADRQKMRRYICARIPVTGTRVTLAYGGEEPVYADLLPWHDGDSDEWELDIVSNEPDLATLEEVYEHFRFQDMTSVEWRRYLACLARARSLDQKVQSLSPTERELLDAASDMTPSIGMELVEKRATITTGTRRVCFRHW